MTAAETSATVLTPGALLDHWQGHRRLTRRVIEAFPEDKLFSFSLGGMRPFSEMVMEFLTMASRSRTVSRPANGWKIKFEA